MSCTIFYKGTLNEKSTPKDVIDTIQKHMKYINADLKYTDDSIVINFKSRLSEPLVFNFVNNSINSYCKWDGNNSEEFYRILDIFIELKHLFKILEVEDEEGLWYGYNIQKQPCKINLRSLSASNELQLLNRIINNNHNELNEIENYIISLSRLCPFNQSLLRIIVQDFIKIMQIENIKDFSRKAIVVLMDQITFVNDHFAKTDLKYFEFDTILMRLWISYVFTYKNMRIVKDLPENIKGLKSSKLAALFGILSIFLNCHGGVVNEKHAQMKKFAAMYYMSYPLGEVLVKDKPEVEMELFFSMMDYLGFSYVGIE